MGARDPTEAVEVFDRLLKFFGDGERWVKGRLSDRRGNRCLVGALDFVSSHHAIQSDAAERYLADKISAAGDCNDAGGDSARFRASLRRALSGGRYRVSETVLRRDSLSDFNDGCRDFSELRALILQARAAAMSEMDAAAPPGRDLDIESDEFLWLKRSEQYAARLWGEPTFPLRAAKHWLWHSGESIVLSLVLAALFFAGIHLGIAGTAVRDRAIQILSENGYRAAFAVASVIGLGWLVAAYNRAPYLATWGMLEWWKPIAIILMLPACLLVVIGLTTPNPTSVAQEGRVGQPPQGIVRITRHPFLTGVGLWALVHLIGNGDGASLVFFATWAIVALAGTVSIDAKRRRLLGGAWESFATQTSIVPFAAIAARRNRFTPREIGLWRWAIALVAYALMLGGHAPVIGVSPFPV